METALIRDSPFTGFLIIILPHEASRPKRESRMLGGQGREGVKSLNGGYELSKQVAENAQR